MRVAIVGGGLAGLAAALDLVDGGHDVTLLEARPTLGGAVQTLPGRDGEPSPPPDNGQHIALGCFAEYLRFLGRVGESASVSRRRLALPVVDERGHWAEIGRSSLLRYRHLSLRERAGVGVALAAIARADAAGHDGESFGAFLRRCGTSARTIDRFWDVFVRPALNLPTDEVSAAAALFTVKTALLGRAAAGELVLPVRPLGAMHGDAAGRALEAAGATVLVEARVDSLDDLDADAVVVAVPPAESARLLEEPRPELEDSPIVSVHLWFDRPLLRRPLAALLGSAAHWVFDRGALTGEPPAGGGQYLTVVSSGVPELLEVRGRALAELVADELVARLGKAELLWSRVSREPRATVALRPGTAQARPGPATARPNVVRAGAWTATGWPATMESAVRSGRAAARMLSDAKTMVIA